MCFKLFGTKKRIVAVVGVVLILILCIIALALGLYFGLRRAGAVATNGKPCANIGKDILMKKGSAVEATIAALFCEGVVSLQSMGLGGGFQMTIYKHDSGKVETLNAREMAPISANKTMFHKNQSLSDTGGLAAAVPGELMGYWEAYQKYKSGNVEWKELVQPAIDLCMNGITVYPYLAKILKDSEDMIKHSPSLSEILVDTKTHSVLKEGDIIKRPKLLKTLEIIRDKNASALYNGELTDSFVSDVQTMGGIITKEDMKGYKVEWEEPVIAKLKHNITMYTVQPPGAGVILAFILNILNDFVDNNNDVTMYQRIIEAFKHGYGRKTHLGDTDFATEQMHKFIQELVTKDYAEEVRKKIYDNKTSTDPKYYEATGASRENLGTAHISVLAPNGDAVSVTSSINLYFGAKARSITTGIILNNVMRDFSSPGIKPFDNPPLPNNYIEPKKRPLSSMTPSIFVDTNGDVKLITGSAGGTTITTTTALIAMQVLWFGKNLKEAVDAPRVHHDIFTGEMKLLYEDGIPEHIINGLKKIGHEIQNQTPIGSSVTGVAIEGTTVEAAVDIRRGGEAEVFYVFP